MPTKSEIARQRRAKQEADLFFDVSSGEPSPIQRELHGMTPSMTRKHLKKRSEARSEKDAFRRRRSARKKKGK